MSMKWAYQVKDCRKDCRSTVYHFVKVKIKIENTSILSHHNIYCFDKTCNSLTFSKTSIRNNLFFTRISLLWYWYKRFEDHILLCVSVWLEMSYQWVFHSTYEVLINCSFSYKDWFLILQVAVTSGYIKPSY